MPGLELFFFGLTAAFLGVSQPQPTTSKPSSQESIRYVSVAGKLFLAHRQSFGALLSSNGIKDAGLVASDALSNMSFDDDVERLLEHGW